MDKKRVIKKNVFFIALSVLAVVAIGLSIYLAFFFSEDCTDITCFKYNMEKCSKARYINEGVESTWQYKIVGKSDGLCDVEVRLLQTKEGSLKLSRLNGLEMTCAYPEGVFKYPEKDLDRCRGILKEEIQSIIIENLHNYIVDNVGEISEVISKTSV